MSDAQPLRKGLFSLWHREKHVKLTNTTSVVTPVSVDFDIEIHGYVFGAGFKIAASCYCHLMGVSACCACCDVIGPLDRPAWHVVIIDSIIHSIRMFMASTT